MPDDEFNREHLKKLRGVTSFTESLKWRGKFRFPDKVGGIDRATLVDPSGEAIPEHLTQVKTGERVSINGCNFYVVYVGAGSVLLEPIKLLPEPPKLPPHGFPLPGSGR